ncbi:Sulfoquinovosyl transferase SQD2 [Camellia lanceoleosa]|uniref:Sulfoquinovosyl transferase SQD2 n=1 Tax=Camellia lanceoleosa TaxID=1840588 RepID=A0ACC0F818_9ERIC|nr:Sulfoquinovosyl transferase SQD2 [Camellia lanceoleosa]
MIIICKGKFEFKSEKKEGEMEGELEHAVMDRFVNCLVSLTGDGKGNVAGGSGNSEGEFLHRAADLTLVPSAALAKELEVARVTAGNKIRLWNKGVDSESFHPKYRAQEMRIRLSVMDQIPEARIAFIGDGPYREDLEKLFSGMLAIFTGMLGGVASLLAKRSMSFSAIEIIALKNREPTESINLNKETEGSSSNRSENSSEIKVDISTRTPPAMDSPSSNHHHGHPIIQTSSSRPLFPPSIITRPTSAAVVHLFPNSSSSSRQPDHKIIDHQNAVKEESFSNMFCAIDDQSGFWPWLEQQHFN